MFIRSQNGIQIVNMEKVIRLYIEPSRQVNEKGEIDLNPPYRIYAEVGGSVEPFLGEYENEERAIWVLSDICASLHRTKPESVIHMPAE